MKRVRGTEREPSRRDLFALFGGALKEVLDDLPEVMAAYATGVLVNPKVKSTRELAEAAKAASDKRLTDKKALAEVVSAISQASNIEDPAGRELAYALIIAENAHVLSKIEEIRELIYDAGVTVVEYDEANAPFRPSEKFID